MSSHRLRRGSIGVFALAVITCVAVVALWLRSHFYADQVGWVCDSWALIADSDTGTVSVTFSSDLNEVGRMQFQAGAGLIYFAKRPSLYAATFASWANTGFDYENDGKMRELAIPYYAVSVMTGLVMLWTGVRVFRRKMADSGICATCGYDLRMNTTGVCPECGNAIAARTLRPSASGNPDP